MSRDDRWFLRALDIRSERIEENDERRWWAGGDGFLRRRARKRKSWRLRACKEEGESETETDGWQWWAGSCGAVRGRGKSPKTMTVDWTAKRERERRLGATVELGFFLTLAKNWFPKLVRSVRFPSRSSLGTSNRTDFNRFPKNGTGSPTYFLGGSV